MNHFFTLFVSQLLICFRPLDNTTMAWWASPFNIITLVSDEFLFSAHKLFCMEGKALTLMYTLLQSPHLKFFAFSPFSIWYDIISRWVSFLCTLTVWHENQRTYTDIHFITNFALKRIWSWPKTFDILFFHHFLILLIRIGILNASPALLGGIVWASPALKCGILRASPALKYGILRASPALLPSPAWC